MKAPVTHRDLTGDQNLDDLIVYYGIRGYRTPDYWIVPGIIMSTSDAERIGGSDWANRWTLQLGTVPFFTAPDWTCEPDLVALARLIVTLRRHRWYRRLERILERGGKRDA